MRVNNEMVIIFKFASDILALLPPKVSAIW